MWSYLVFSTTRNGNKEHAEIYLESPFTAMGVANKWGAFTSRLTRLKGRRVPVKLKAEDGRFKEPWLKRDVWKNETSDLGCWDKLNPTYKKCRGMFLKGNWEGKKT